jgi:hypothetical protein
MKAMQGRIALQKHFRAKSYGTAALFCAELWECARVLAPLLDPTN